MGLLFAQHVILTLNLNVLFNNVHNVSRPGDYYIGGFYNGLQVHVRFWLCRDSLQLSCVCAVAVREGNAILGVDMCGSRSGRDVIRPKIKQYSPSDWGLSAGAFVSTNGENTFYVSSTIYMQ